MKGYPEIRRVLMKQSYCGAGLDSSVLAGAISNRKNPILFYNGRQFHTRLLIGVAFLTPIGTQSCY
jgi:hypothetical protein